MSYTEEQNSASEAAELERLRNEHESHTEWNLRKKFLTANVNSLELDRLVCLSHCFVNMTMYGCSYPAPVMAEVLDRSGGMVQEVKVEAKSKLKQKYAMSFVKASNDAGATSTVDANAELEMSNTLQKSQGRKSELAGEDSVLTKKSQKKGRSISKKASAANKNKATVVDVNEDHPGPSSIKLLCSDAYWNCNIESESIDNLKPSVYERAVVTKPTRENLSSLVTEQPDPLISKLQELAEAVTLLKDRQENVKQKLHSAATRVHIELDFLFDRVVLGKTDQAQCRVLLDNVEIATGHAPNSKNAKTNACEAVLQKLTMPHMQIVEVSPGKRQLQVSDKPLRSIDKAQHQTLDYPSLMENDYVKVSSHIPGVSMRFKDFGTSQKESNIQGISLKRKFSKSLEEFIVIEARDPERQRKPSDILRQSADFSQMILEYEYFPYGDTLRCIVKIEDQVLAEGSGCSKATAKDSASASCLVVLKEICWTLKTKPSANAEDSVSKDEILNAIKGKSEEIGTGNIGNKMLRKMGWTGGGVGKEGSGIAEPIQLSSVINRRGLGHHSAADDAEEFRKHVRELLKNYAISGKQEDLVFSSELDIEERKLIHEEAHKLNLRSTSRGKGQNRYLCVSVKRTANQLFNHVLSEGGETVKYKLIPPGADEEMLPQELYS